MKRQMSIRWMISCITLCICHSFATRLRNANDCGIEGVGELPFLSVEIPESTPQGEIIATRETFNVENEPPSIFEEATDYIDIRLRENNTTQEFQLQFILKANLSDFRQKKWDPVVQLEFSLNCKRPVGDLPEVPQKNFTLLIVIKDEPIYAPTFEHKEYKIYISENKTKAESNSSELLNDRVPIIITDLDFNKDFAIVDVNCAEINEDEGYCHYVNVSAEPITSYDKSLGKRFQLNIYLAEPIEKEIKFKVIATDGYEHNSTEYSSAKITLINKSPEMEESNFPLIPLSSGIAVIVLILCGAFGFMTYKKTKIENTLRKLTEVEIREFEQGSANISNAGKRSVTVDVNAPIMSLPYQRQFDIPRENLRIDETSVLGTGAFGIVMKGFVHFGGDSIVVAVKTVKRNVGVLYFKALLSELKIMAYIGKHKNVVSLIGACTHNIRKRELYIAVEFCANGNFHNYLKCRKDTFSNFVSDGKLNCGQTNPYGRRFSFSKTISTFDLIRWAYQIASGMEFLRSKSVIHGDMAARNVLLDEHRIAKIADFGLSRRIVDYHSNYYHTKTSNNTPLPWKWMAPESLKYMTFSHKSDIWSFGVVLWETFTLGQTPYPGLSWSETFVDRLEKGLRMTKAQFASDNLHLMMQDCWQTDPDDRPVIDDLKRLLEQMMNEILQQQGNGYLRVLGEKQLMSLKRDSIDEYSIPKYQYYVATEL